MIWELGEHLATILSPVAWMLKPVWKCNCEDRRTRLNALGERWFAYWFPVWHQKKVACWVVQTQRTLADNVSYVEELCDSVSHFKISKNTATRWLDDLVKAGKVSAITLSGRKLYGLPYILRV